MWVLETIPDSKSLHWVAEILIYGGLWKTIRLPHLMFLLQVEALIAALSIQMLYVYIAIFFEIVQPAAASADSLTQGSLARVRG